MKNRFNLIFPLGRLVVFTVLLAFACGCASKDAAKTTIDYPVISTASANGQLSAEKLGNIITAACAKCGWRVDSTGRSMVEATYIRPEGGSATVDITFTADKIEIRYRSSVRMRYDGMKIRISYNKWVNELAAAIRKGIAAY